MRNVNGYTKQLEAKIELKLGSEDAVYGPL